MATNEYSALQRVLRLHSLSGVKRMALQFYSRGTAWITLAVNQHCLGLQCSMAMPLPQGVLDCNANPHSAELLHKQNCMTL